MKSTGKGECESKGRYKKSKVVKIKAGRETEAELKNKITRVSVIRSQQSQGYIHRCSEFKETQDGVGMKFKRDMENTNDEIQTRLEGTAEKAELKQLE